MSDKKCALNFMYPALDFIREMGSFKTSELQRHLKCGYGTVCQVIDALLVLCVIEIEKESPRMYRVIVPTEELEYDIFYNGLVHENDDENNSAWDPSLFRKRSDCLEYVKGSYTSFDNPVYVIDKVRLGNGWELIEKEIIVCDKNGGDISE